MKAIVAFCISILFVRKLFLPVEQGCYFILVTDICLPNEQTGNWQRTKKLQEEKLFPDDSCAFVKHISNIKFCFSHKSVQMCCKKGRCSGQ